MNASTPRIPHSEPSRQPLPSAADEGEMNEVLLGLAWMLADKVIRKAKASAATA